MPDHQRSLPQGVAIRMTPEDVASAFALKLSPDDVPVTPRGEKPKANSLYVREPTCDRGSAIWYWNEDYDGVVGRVSTRRRVDDHEGAVAWVMRRLVRRADVARARLAPESMLLAEVLLDYFVLVGNQLKQGQIKPGTYDCYRKSLARLNASFGTAHLGQVSAGGALRHQTWCRQNGLAQNTAVRDGTLLKGGVNRVMEDRGSTFRLTFAVGAGVPGEKQPFEPGEVDRMMDTASTGQVYGPDKRPVLDVDPTTGASVPRRVSRARLQSFHPFVVAIPFSLETGTRSQALCEVTYTEPSGPWLDLDEGVLHRRGQTKPDSRGKRRGSCVLSSRFMRFVDPIAEAGFEAGRVHMVTNWQGRPLKRLDNRALSNLLAAAAVPRRTVHCLKDTAVQIAKREHIPLQVAAERFGTTEKTLTRNYGAGWDLRLQVDAAEAMGERRTWAAGEDALARRRAKVEEGRQATAALREANGLLVGSKPGKGRVAAEGGRVRRALAEPSKARGLPPCPSGVPARVHSARPWPERQKNRPRSPADTFGAARTGAVEKRLCVGECASEARKED